MFKSQTLAEHVLRGVLGLAALGLSVELLRISGLMALVAAVAMLGLSLFMLRGCPTCWTIGLIQTIYSQFVGKTCAKTHFGDKASCDNSC